MVPQDSQDAPDLQAPDGLQRCGLRRLLLLLPLSRLLVRAAEALKHSQSIKQVSRRGLPVGCGGGLGLPALPLWRPAVAAVRGRAPRPQLAQALAHEPGPLGGRPLQAAYELRVEALGPGRGLGQLGSLSGQGADEVVLPSLPLHPLLDALHGLGVPKATAGQVSHGVHVRGLLPPALLPPQQRTKAALATQQAEQHTHHAGMASIHGFQECGSAAFILKVFVAEE
mmetsp:Transcript_50994/g.159946  ORF Transcript_50994/g.159946 Transcript_50994/m.159946 type:complete len:226 (-) Transcript_50994:81-758(-)